MKYGVTFSVPCRNVTEPEGTPCKGHLTFGPDDREAPCDTCGGRCGRLVAAGSGWWVLIERDEAYVPEGEKTDLLVGPYPNEQMAVIAMNESLLIEGFVQENCLDCYVMCGYQNDFDEVILVDLNDPDHTGVKP